MARKKTVKKPKTAAKSAKKNVWFVRVRGSYLPSSKEGWLLYIPLLLLIAAVGYVVYLGRDMLVLYLAFAAVLMVAIGYTFTLIAKDHS